MIGRYDDLIFLSTSSRQGSLDLIGVMPHEPHFIELMQEGTALGRLFAYAGGLASIAAWNTPSFLIPWDSVPGSLTLSAIFLLVDIIGALGSACAAAAFLALRPRAT